MLQIFAALLAFLTAFLCLKLRDKVLARRLRHELTLPPAEAREGVPLIWKTALDGQPTRFQFVCSADSVTIHINSPRFRLSLPERPAEFLRWEEFGTFGRLTYRLDTDHDREKTIQLPLTIFRSAEGKQALWWLRNLAFTASSK